jgi:prepilin peptidase CpaA
MQSAAAIGLVAFLVLACLTDFRSRRIPNVLVGVGVILAIFFQAATVKGGGLFVSTGAGGLGVWSALLGVLAALLLLLPVYAVRWLGAGDVKLMAMVGAWLGAPAIFWAMLWTAVAGGVLSIVFMLATRSGSTVFQNFQVMANPLLQRILGAQSWLDRGEAQTAPLKPTGRMPYAFAIAAGSIAEMVRQWA